jgi:dipeptidyl aminopeptidase/acylaminoacyl peptidase
VNDRRIAELLRERPAPDEQAAQERGWRVVREAFAEREPAPRGWRPRRVVVALAAVLALLAAGLTPPGQAVADWLEDAVRPGRDDARDALVSLPAPGRLLVTSERGPWVVDHDGSKRLLGVYDDASWSPRGLFIVATRGHDVVALEPGGRPRWSLARPGRVRAARWSPDGFRISYHAGDTLRVVAGDGTGDRLLARQVAGAAAAWWPRAAHRVAFVDARGRVSTIQGDSGRVVWRSAPVGDVQELAWSYDGTRLLALGPRALRLFDARGRMLAVLPMPGGTRAQAAAFRPVDYSFALLTYRAASDRSRLELVELEDGPVRRDRLLAGAGRFGDLAWSPDARWLLAAWSDADQWVFIRTGAGPRAGIQRLRAVGNISTQFDPGGRGGAFPGLGGWCCAPVGLSKGTTVPPSPGP